MENEKRLILNSGAPNILIKNTLSHFQNSLYDRNYLNPNLEYAITARNISIDLNFKNPACAKNVAFPALICTPMKHITNIASYPNNMKLKIDNNDFKWYDSSVTQSHTIPNENIVLHLSKFYNVHRFYLKEHKQYTILDLYQEWSHKDKLIYKLRKQANATNLINYKNEKLQPKSKLLSFNTDSIILGQHPIEKNEINSPMGNIELNADDKTVLFFHYKFAEKLELEEEMDGIIKIDDEKYYFYYNDGAINKGIEIRYDNKSLLFETPTILKIVCKNIEPYFNNNSYCQVIGFVHLNEEDKYKSFHHTFKGNEFFTLRNNINELFEIIILDENNKKLKLSKGVPTILELSGVENHTMSLEENIIGNSEKSKFFQNSPTNFKFHLSQTLQYNEEWKCAISSITFKNDFKNDNTFDFSFTYVQYDGNDNEKLSKSITIDHTLKTPMQIYETFRDSLLSHDDIESQYNGETIAISTLNHPNIMSIVFGCKTKVYFSKHLAQLLGIITEPYTTELPQITVGNNIIVNQGGMYIASMPLDLNFDLSPKFMFIECNFLKNIPVGNGSSRILKIIPLSNQPTQKYTTIHFEYLDFHEIEHSQFQTLDFKLLSQSGNLLQMYESPTYSETWIKLVFKKFRK